MRLNINRQFLMPLKSYGYYGQGTHLTLTPLSRIGFK